MTQQPTHSTSVLAAHLGIQQLHTLDTLDHQADEVAKVIDKLIARIIILANATPKHMAFAVRSRIVELLNTLPKEIAKQAYEGLLKIGRKTAKGTVSALVNSLPLEYLPTQLATKGTAIGVKQAITQLQFRSKIESMLIEPIKKDVLEKIVLGGASQLMKLQQRVKNSYSPHYLADLLVNAISKGEDRRTQATLLVRELGVTRSRARMIARTEGARVATETNLAAYEELDVIGFMVHAVLDERTRIEHRRRNGEIYYRNPKQGQKGMDQMPKPPVEPDGTIAFNCRCYLQPIFEPLERQRIKHPLHRAADAKIVPDPLTYDQWFQQAPLRLRRKAVGARRYAAVYKNHPNPSYFHFIDPSTGDLLDVDYLKAETRTQMFIRLDLGRQLARQAKANRKQALLWGGVL